MIYLLLLQTDDDDFILLYQTQLEFINYRDFIIERKAKYILENDFYDMLAVSSNSKTVKYVQCQYFKRSELLLYNSRHFM